MNHPIASVLNESRSFAPSAEFKKSARISSLEEYNLLYQKSLKEPDAFWSEIANQLHWFKPFNKVREWNEPHVKWFTGGQINVSHNCLDRHLTTGRKDKIAILFESEAGQIRKITYKELHAEVCKFAGVLKERGIQKGDRVVIYMPLIPEAAVAMLACARIGAIHSIVFGGFSAQALVERIDDAKAKALITADGGHRRGKIVPLKETAEEALSKCKTIESVLVFKHLGNSVTMQKGRDFYVHDLISTAKPVTEAEPLDSEHPLFILYTSGSTGKPKGVLHTTAGYLTHTYLTTQYVFDLKENDIFWCTADVGWVTGHSYVVYGPLANGATVMMYEGAPDFPQMDRFWDIIDRHKVTTFYTAPTAIRAFMKWGNEWPEKHQLKSLRLLGTVGEPINPEAWVWYHETIGRGRCPIVDTWWQTETGGIMITTLPGVHAAKPGSAGFPMFGVEPAIVDHEGKPVEDGQGGYLVIKRPWPGMLRTVYGDDERYKKQYWSEVPHVYFAGDGARRDEDGYFWVMGRIDDVINVAGHRLGTMEVESALVAHDFVAEAAVVGCPDDIKGQGIYAFVTLEKGKVHSPELAEELKNHVVKEIGAIARPSFIHFTDALPKTRSGKIMRRLLRSIASGEKHSGDMSTLEDQSILEKLHLTSAN